MVRIWFFEKRPDIRLRRQQLFNTPSQVRVSAAGLVEIDGSFLGGRFFQRSEEDRLGFGLFAGHRVAPSLNVNFGNELGATSFTPPT
jgi:hypothetical protein